MDLILVIIGYRFFKVTDYTNKNNDGSITDDEVLLVFLD